MPTARRLEDDQTDKLIAALLIVSITFGSGLEVTREHVVAVFKHTSLLAKAFLANFVVVPIFGVVLAKVFRLPDEVATGFLLMAIAPGVPFLLLKVKERGESMGLAVALVIYLPLLSIITVPVTSSLVLPAGEAAQIPIGRFITTLLLFQFVPLLIGALAANRLPKLVPVFARVSRFVFLAVLAVLLVFLFPKLIGAVKEVFGSNGMLAMLVLVILSEVAGWLSGGPSVEDRRTLATGTTLRNIGLCLLIATQDFDLGLVVPTILVYLLIQFVVVTVVGLYFTRTARKATAA